MSNVRRVRRVLRVLSLTFVAFVLSCFRGQALGRPNCHCSAYFPPQPRERTALRTAHVFAGIVAAHLGDEIHFTEDSCKCEA